MEILEAIGEDLSTANLHVLACTLRACVRKGKIFTRTAPCTFGLLEFAGSSLPPQPRQAGRPGTRIAKARTFLNTVGRPAQVMEILEAIGEDLNLPNRHGLYATLQASVHKGEIFTQTAPYTFGLLEFADANR
jgi:hypothetical protein